MFCTNCGKSIPDTANFCASCGAKAGSPADASPPQSTSSANSALTPPSLAKHIPENDAQSSGSSVLTWIWYLVVFALFNVLGRNFADAIFGPGTGAFVGYVLGILGTLAALAIWRRASRANTRLLIGIGIVVVACVLALVAQVMKETFRPAKQHTIVAAAPTAQTDASGELSDADVFGTSPEQQVVTTSLDVPDPFATRPQPAVAQNANCTDYASAAIPSQYTGARISINFQSVPIDTFLNVISKESGITIININNLDDPITICATNIPWDYALDTVLSAHGHTRNTIGEAIYIH